MILDETTVTSAGGGLQGRSVGMDQAVLWPVGPHRAPSALLHLKHAPALSQQFLPMLLASCMVRNTHHSQYAYMLCSAST